MTDEGGRAARPAKKSDADFELREPLGATHFECRAATVAGVTSDGTLNASTTAWVVTDGKIGDEVHCFGIAEAMGLKAERRLIAPRLPWAALAPRGPIDPRDRPSRRGSAIRLPFPDILIASGRRTVPYMRFVKRASQGRTFTVFLKDPRTGTRTADAIWVPEHDPLRGGNVFVTLTSPHLVTPQVLAAARGAPDPRLSCLPQPRAALILGGRSGHHHFRAKDTARLGDLAVACVELGFSLMVTPSRRTPDSFLDTVRTALAAKGSLGNRAFVWDRTGENPYPQILANADRIVVTGDSVNMIGEATSTGAPVYIFVPSGVGYYKMKAFIERLVGEGAARRWMGRLDPYSYTPIDATPEIAALIRGRYAAFLARTDSG